MVLVGDAFTQEDENEKENLRIVNLIFTGLVEEKPAKEQKKGYSQG